MTGTPCVHEFIFKYNVKNQVTCMDSFTLPLIFAKPCHYVKHSDSRTLHRCNRLMRSLPRQSFNSARFRPEFCQLMSNIWNMQISHQFLMPNIPLTRLIVDLSLLRCDTNMQISRRYFRNYHKNIRKQCNIITVNCYPNNKQNGFSRLGGRELPKCICFQSSNSYSHSGSVFMSQMIVHFMMLVINQSIFTEE